MIYFCVQAFTKACFNVLEKVNPNGKGGARKRKKKTRNEKKGQGLVTGL